mgnify:CR=1 FL=1
MVSISTIIITLLKDARGTLTVSRPSWNGFVLIYLIFTPKIIFHPHIISWEWHFFMHLAGGQPKKLGFLGTRKGLGWSSVKGQASFLAPSKTATPLTCYRVTGTQVSLLDGIRAQRLTPVFRACSPQNHLSDESIDRCLPFCHIPKIVWHHAPQIQSRALYRMDGTIYDLIRFFVVFCLQEFYRLNDQSLSVSIYPELLGSPTGHWFQNSAPFQDFLSTIIISMIYIE